MGKAFARIALCLCLAWAGPAAASTTLVDTGPGAQIGGGSTLENAAFIQFLAGQFTLPGSVTIDTVEGWLGTNTAGTIDVDLLSDEAGHPGAVLFTGALGSAFDPTPHWEAISGLGWSVGAGTYWIAFEPESGYVGVMPGLVPFPLPKYAFASAIPPSWTIASSGNIGVRILSPEPGAEALGPLALAALALVAWRSPTSRSPRRAARHH